MLPEPCQTRRRLIPINYDTIFYEGLSNVFCNCSSVGDVPCQNQDSLVQLKNCVLFVIPVYVIERNALCSCLSVFFEPLERSQTSYLVHCFKHGIEFIR